VHTLAVVTARTRHPARLGDRQRESLSDDGKFTLQLGSLGRRRFYGLRLRFVFLDLLLDYINLGLIVFSLFGVQPYVQLFTGVAQFLEPSLSGVVFQFRIL